MSEVRSARRDAEHYNYFRDYDPSIGRYVESDPIGLTSDSAARFFERNRRNGPVVTWLLADSGKNWGSTNLYSYVRSGPLGATDPLGLWSVSGGGYDGVGGELTFGRNPDGRWFASIRVGLGIGWGGSYDPHGTSPAADQCKCGWNSAYGGYGYFQFARGPFFVGASANGGMVMNPGCGGPTRYFDAQPFSYGLELDETWRWRRAAAAGFELALF